MSLNIVKKVIVGAVLIWIQIYELAMGGFTLDETGLSEGDIVPGGSVMGFDEDTRKARVVKTAKVYADALPADVAATMEVEVGGVDLAITAKASDGAIANGIVINFVEGTEGVAWDGDTLTVTLTTDDETYTAAAIKALINGATAGAPAGLNVADINVTGTGTLDLSTAVTDVTGTFAGGGDDELIKVVKGHLFVVGEYIGKTIGGKAYAIASIDKTNADYDVFTMATAIEAVSEGDALFQSSASGSTACAYIVTPKGLLHNDTTATGGEQCGVVLRGTVYSRRIPASTAAIKALLPNIVFSESY